MTPEEYLRERLEYHLPDEEGKGEMVALLLPLFVMGVRPSAEVWQGLREEVAQAVVLALKDDAERHWRISWDGSLERANQIIAVGEARADLAVQALGTMAKADAIKIVTGRLEEAWELLDYAGRLYRMSHLPENEREIGWARTRIGRVYICAEVGKIEQGFAEAEEAREILEREEVWQRLIALHLAWGNTFNVLYQFLDARRQYQTVLDIISEQTGVAEMYLPVVYNNLANTEWHLGNKRIALHYYQQVAEETRRRSETAGWALAQHNIAALYIAQGKYQLGLRTLQIAEPILKERMPEVWLITVENLIECFIALNRPDDAQTWCDLLLQKSIMGMAGMQRARFLIWLAETKRALGFTQEAASLFATAHQLYTELQMELPAAHAKLRELEIQADQNYFKMIEAVVPKLMGIWQQQKSPEGLAQSLILLAKGHLHAHQYSEAVSHSRAAIGAAKQMSLDLVRYQAHLLLGHALKASDKIKLARRHYQAAVSAIVRLRNDTGYAHRSDFLQTRLEAFHELVALELKQGHVENALSVLEGFKGITFRKYLHHNEHFRWSNIPENEALRSELEQRKQELAQLERQKEGNGAYDFSDKQQKLVHRIRQITETLYLYTQGSLLESDWTVKGKEIQARLPQSATLIEFYNDGKQVWRFQVSQASIKVDLLDTQVSQLDTLIFELYEHLQGVIRSLNPRDIVAQVQARKARIHLKKLGAILLAGVEADVFALDTLYVVPFGLLHILPFNLLRINGAYLIEQIGIVTLPSASLIRPHNRQPLSGRRWIGYSHNGKLPQATAEARHLQTRWGGELYCDEDAGTAVLSRGPSQVLHVSTHGIHQIAHHFDLSSLAFADRDIYGDDLLQLDLRHDLVTLSACEAGFVRVAGGDEIMGLGRAFLFSGAASMVMSLWQIREDMSFRIMDRFYEGVFGGNRKPQALRRAQVELLTEEPGLHPVYWGAFQFVGNPDALL